MKKFIDECVIGRNMSALYYHIRGILWLMVKCRQKRMMFDKKFGKQLYQGIPFPLYKIHLHFISRLLT